jgi:hypothetical protein
MTIHYLWAGLHYKCEKGHHNSLNKFFVCPTDEVGNEELLRHLPRQWHCALCANVSPAIVEILSHWLTPTEWARLGNDERLSAITLPPNVEPTGDDE